MTFQSQQQHQEVLLSRRRIISSHRIPDDLGPHNQQQPKNENENEEDSISSKGIESAIHQLSKQVDSDVDLLQHLEEDFKADLEKMARGFDGAFRDRGASIAHQVNLGQLQLGLHRHEHGHGHGHTQNTLSGSEEEDDNKEEEEDAFSSSNTDLSSDIGGSIGDDTDLQQAEEIKQMLQLVDIEFLTEQERLPFLTKQLEDSDEEDIISFPPRIQHDPTTTITTTRKHIGDHVSSSIITKIDSEMDDNYQGLENTSLPTGESYRQCNQKTMKSQDRPTRMTNIPPDDFFYETPQKPPNNDPNIVWTAKLQPENNGDLQFTQSTRSPSNPDDITETVAPTFPALRRVLQTPKSFITNSFSTLFVISKQQDNSCQTPCSVNTPEQPPSQVSPQTNALSPNNSPTNHESAIINNRSNQRRRNHRKKIVALLLPAAGIGLFTTAMAGASFMVGFVDVVETNNYCGGHNEGRTDSFLFQISSVFQYSEWFDVAMTLYGID